MRSASHGSAFRLCCLEAADGMLMIKLINITGMELACSKSDNVSCLRDVRCFYEVGEKANCCCLLVLNADLVHYIINHYT